MDIYTQISLFILKAVSYLAYNINCNLSVVVITVHMT